MEDLKISFSFFFSSFLLTVASDFYSKLFSKPYCYIFESRGCELEADKNCDIVSLRSTLHTDSQFKNGRLLLETFLVTVHCGEKLYCTTRSDSALSGHQRGIFTLLPFTTNNLPFYICTYIKDNERHRDHTRTSQTSWTYLTSRAVLECDSVR
jgi:hypothetical protein